MQSYYSNYSSLYSKSNGNNVSALRFSDISDIWSDWRFMANKTEVYDK